MQTKYYNCELLTDVIINASLATEGNMQSLDYIPGSNFWGIVASQKYGPLVKEKDYEALLDLFHNGTVCFGDAHIALHGKPTYSIPLSLSKDKLAENIFNTNIYLQHILELNNIRPDKKNEAKVKSFIQLKQLRSGYFSSDYTYLNEIKKKRSLKSAYDRITRKSADEQMFGFDAICAGQDFIFSINYKEEKYIPIVEKVLLGERQIGKSKHAQYGQVYIKKIDTPSTFPSSLDDQGELQLFHDDLILVYAASNICLIDEYGNSTFQPNAKRDFKVNGSICWEISNIRTYSYAPWNNHRKTSDPQRDCICKGSIIAIRLAPNTSALKVQSLPKAIGTFNAEGLGQVFYNPSFLKGHQNDGKWAARFKEYKNTPKDKAPLSNTPTLLSIYLSNQKQQAETVLQIGKKIIDFTEETKQAFKNISNSQWGQIGAIANQAKTTEALRAKLFGAQKIESVDPTKKNGFLVSGVAAKRYWLKQGGKPWKTLWDGIEKHDAIAPIFLEKFARQKAKQSKTS